VSSENSLVRRTYARLVLAYPGPCADDCNSEECYYTKVQEQTLPFPSLPFTSTLPFAKIARLLEQLMDSLDGGGSDLLHADLGPGFCLFVSERGTYLCPYHPPQHQNDRTRHWDLHSHALKSTHRPETRLLV
jgi:hypothetical protein